MSGHDTNRRRFLRLGVAGAAVGLSGCQGLLGSSGPPEASFRFTYEPDGGESGGSLEIRHDSGDGIRADRLSIESSTGESALWSALGSTSVAASEQVTPGDTARIDATVTNWPEDVGIDERVKVLYTSDETTTRLAEFVSDRTPTPTPEPTPTPTPAPTGVIESFESDSLSNYRGDLQAFETSDARSTDGSVALRSNTTTFSRITAEEGSVQTLSRGDTVACDVYFSDGDGRAGIVLFANTAGGGYQFDVENADGTIDIKARSAEGANNGLAESRVDVPSGEWLTIRVETSSNVLTHRLLDSSGRELASISATDTRHSEGGIGFTQNRVVGSNWVYFDNVRFG